MTLYKPGHILRFLHYIKMPKGPSAVIESPLCLNSEETDKSVLFSIIDYNLFWTDIISIWYLYNEDLKTSCLHEIQVQIVKKYGYLIGPKNRLDISLSYDT